jgi:hypothetical protein
MYFSKDRKEKKSYEAPEWLAAMGSHLPERGQQSVRCYGAYANSTRGRERERDADDGVPTGLEPDPCSREIKQKRRTTSPRRLPPTGSVDAALRGGSQHGQRPRMPENRLSGSLFGMYPRTDAGP